MGLLILFVGVTVIGGACLALVHGRGLLESAWWFARVLVLGVASIGVPFMAIALCGLLVVAGAERLYPTLGLALGLPIFLAGAVAWGEFRTKLYPRIEAWLGKVMGPAPGERRAQLKEMMEAARSGEAWLERATPAASAAPRGDVQESKWQRALPGRGPSDSQAN